MGRSRLFLFEEFCELVYELVEQLSGTVDVGIAVVHTLITVGTYRGADSLVIGAGHFCQVVAARALPAVLNSLCWNFDLDSACLRHGNRNLLQTQV